MFRSAKTENDAGCDKPPSLDGDFVLEASFSSFARSVANVSVREMGRGVEIESPLVWVRFLCECLSKNTLKIFISYLIFD